MSDDKQQWDQDHLNPLTFDDLVRRAARIKLPSPDGWQGCRLPDWGWWCSRTPEHEGPCATRKLEGL